MGKSVNWFLIRVLSIKSRARTVTGVGCCYSRMGSGGLSLDSPRDDELHV